MTPEEIPMTSRRAFLSGLGSIIAAPAIVKASSLMPVRGIVMPRIIGADWPYRVIPCPPELDMFRLLQEAMDEMKENTRKMFAINPVALRTTFENGRFVQREISANDFYR
jgi:hypothetical protein